MTKYFEIVPYSLLFAWFVFSIYYLRRAKRRPNEINPYIFDSIPQVFPTIGILGTFLGIAIGLWQFDVTKIEESIPLLLQGLKTAFIASIFGITLSIIFSKFTAIRQRRNERGKQSDETIALNKLIDLITDLKNSFNDNFIYTDEENNKIKPANYFRDIYAESQKQSLALQTFSTDLAIKVEAGFEKIISTPDHGVIAELQSLKAEIENLGKKLQDPSTEMTNTIVKDLQATLKNMMDEFKTSVSGSAKTELENLTRSLNVAGGSLTSFPERLEQMTNNLNHNFEQLKEVISATLQQSSSHATNSNSEMRKQVEEMSEILKEKVGELQTGQQTLMTQQSENLLVSDKLLNAFNTSIEKMNGLSKEVTGSISQLSNAQAEFDKLTTGFRILTGNVNSSSRNFSEAQLKFAEHSNHFLENNKETIDEIQKSLMKAKETSTDYAQKFLVIEHGLQGIFNQIQTGLTNYRNTVGESLEKFLSKYTNSLTSTAKSMADASASQQSILEELTEQLSKINARRN